MLLAFIEREEHINSHNQLNHTGKDRLSPQNSGHFLDYFQLIIFFTCHLSQTTRSEE